MVMVGRGSGRETQNVAAVLAGNTGGSTPAMSSLCANTYSHFGHGVCRCVCVGALMQTMAGLLPDVLKVQLWPTYSCKLSTVGRLDVNVSPELSALNPKS